MFVNAKRVEKTRLQKFVAVVMSVREHKGFLRTPLGKELLQELVDLRLNWPEAVEIFGRSQGTIEKACSYHGVRRPRNYHVSWPDEAIEVVKRHGRKIAVARNRREISVYYRAMQREVNEVLAKMGDSPKSSHAVRCFARSIGVRSSGYTHITWGRKAFTVLKRFYAKSSGLRTKADSVALTAKMRDALAKVFADEGLPLPSLHAIRQFAYNKNLHWGWRNGQYPSPKSLAEKERQDDELAKFMASQNSPQLWKP
jgi:hypothetical protein